jgi:iron complex outermembrane recepter protein
VRYAASMLRTSCAGAVAALGAIGCPAWAQDGGAAAPPAASTETLQEVVVTANKRSESVREVPATVTVMSGDKLQAIGATSLQDFATYIPGLSYASEGIGENQIAIRGVTTGAQISSTVGIYVDETPIGSSSAFALGSYGLDFNVFDLQRLEVLSGPQGTLYGASTLGGLLKYVTMPPDLSVYGASVQSEASDTANGGLNHSERGAINLPIIPHRLAIRIDGFDESDAGYVDDPTRALKDVNTARTLGGRVSLLGKPTPDLSLRLSLMEQGIERNGSSEVDRSAQTHQPMPGEGQYDQSTVVDQPLSSHLLLYSGLLEWNLHWAQLTSMSSWQDVAINGALDETAIFGGLLHTGNLIPFEAFDAASVKKYTQELRLSSPQSQWLEWQVGAFYTAEHSDDFLGVTANLANGGTLLGLIPLGALGSDLNVPLLDEPLDSTYRELAGFADGTVHFTDRIDLTLGLRYSGSRQGYQQQQNGVLGLTSELAALLHGGPGSSGGGSRSDVPTYLFSPRFHLDKDSMIYARVASGFRPGGPNYIAPAPFPSGPPTFNPDTVWNYEAGAKTMFLDRRVSVDFDVFYIDWNKILLLTNLDGNNTIENGGKATVRGLELSTNLKPLRGLDIGGNMSYSDAALAADVPALGAQKGDRLPMSPRFSAALTADYSIPLNESCLASAGLSYRYVGDRPAGFDGSSTNPQYWMSSYKIVDLRLGLQTPYANFSLFLKNVFNDLGEISADPSALEHNPDGPVRVAIAQPRTFGLMVTLGWNSDQ